MIAFVADCHVGNRPAGGLPGPDGLNDVGRASVAVLHRAVEQAATAGARTFVVAGDLFHSRRPEPAIVAAVQRAFSTAQASGLKVIVVPGNHDMLDTNAAGRNTACEPLWQSAHVVGEPQSMLTAAGEKLELVPFQSDQPMAAYLQDLVPRLPANPTKSAHVLVTHVGAWDDTDPPWLRSASDGIEAKVLLGIAAAHLGLVVVGNFHQHRTWAQDTTRLVQVGTLCPGSHSDQGVFPQVGGMLLWEAGSPARWSMVEVPGPRFLPSDAELPDAVVGTTFTLQAPKPTSSAVPGPAVPAVTAEASIEDYVRASALPAGVLADDVLTEALRFYRGAQR